MYKETDMDEILVLLGYLTELGVDGLMLSPAYGYDAVREADLQAGDALFLTRDEVHAKFRRVRQQLRGFRVTATPIYMDFLCGQRTLPCAAYANPTRNVRGWKGPCYLVTDAHYASYRELLAQTDWNALGPGRDPRCAHCLVHCGFEPAAVLANNGGIRDALRMAVWQMR